MSGSDLGGTLLKLTLIKRNRFAAYAIVITILTVLAFTVSCRKDMSHSYIGTVEPSPRTPLPSGVGLSTYHGVGTVQEVDRKNIAIMINHEEITGYMPAMSMEYHPRDRMLLDAVKPGERIEFALEDAAGITTITDIRKR
jgi:Cu/Ag efflux protein CusF